MAEMDAPQVKVRIDFTVSAHALFLQCSRKEREGLLRKLKEFVLHPALGKPLHASLAGYYRISYGRMRCVVRNNTKDPVLLVLVLAPRKEGARDDAYALAVAAIRTADPSIDALFAKYVRAYIEEQAVAQQFRDVDAKKFKV
jgi:hypothetical protein